MPLKQQILNEIKQQGSITVDRYMELCNTHYYATRDPLGKDGDFITAPEISQIFGEMVGVWAITAWDRIGRPENCAIMELGPGRGTLMADLLRSIKVMPGFKPQIHLVETSPTLRQAQKDKLAGYDVEWHDKYTALDIPTIIIANEFFDALPFKQFIAGKERTILAEEKGNLYFSQPAEDGLTNETCPLGEDITKQIAQTASAGIIVDYGYIQNTKADTLQALKGHKFHNLFDNPGDADLTALVDFGKIREILTSYSRNTVTITTQREFLLAHGADVRAKILGKDDDLDRLINPQQMGELFKVLCF